MAVVESLLLPPTSRLVAFLWLGSATNAFRHEGVAVFRSPFCFSGGRRDGLYNHRHRFLTKIP